ncbi:MAG: isocitrate/isopropylmalate dehydrogenase family protein [bacterium]
MAKHRIGWLPGDGVGRDVMEAAHLVLDKLRLDAEYLHGEIGWNYWCTEGNPLPERTVELLKNTHACLLGAITSKPREEAERDLLPELQNQGLAYHSAILQLRQKFHLHTNIRPCKAFAGNPLNFRHDIDIVVFRENSECLYAGLEFHPLPPEVSQAIAAHLPGAQRYADMNPEDVAISLRVMTRSRCLSISQQAFEYARQRGYRTVTVVEKPNVTRETSGMLIREARKTAKRYAEVDFYEANIDHLCMWLLKNPQSFAVLLTSNLFGDILSKLCVQLVGGLGFGASANLGEKYALFEPIHGSAPRLAGQYRVNPIGLLRAVVMMLEYLQENEMARVLENGIATVVQEGKVRTQDMGGESSTIDMAKAIAERI